MNSPDTGSAFVKAMVEAKGGQIVPPVLPDHETSNNPSGIVLSRRQLGKALFLGAATPVMPTMEFFGHVADAVTAFGDRHSGQRDLGNDGSPVPEQNSFIDATAEKIISNTKPVMDCADRLFWENERHLNIAQLLNEVSLLAVDGVIDLDTVFIGTADKLVPISQSAELDSYDRIAVVNTFSAFGEDVTMTYSTISSTEERTEGIYWVVSEISYNNGQDTHGTGEGIAPDLAIWGQAPGGGGTDYNGELIDFHYQLHRAVFSRALEDIICIENFNDEYWHNGAGRSGDLLKSFVEIYNATVYQDRDMLEYAIEQKYSNMLSEWQKTEYTNGFAYELTTRPHGLSHISLPGMTALVDYAGNNLIDSIRYLPFGQFPEGAEIKFLSSQSRFEVLDDTVAATQLVCIEIDKRQYELSLEITPEEYALKATDITTNTTYVGEVARRIAELFFPALRESSLIASPDTVFGVELSENSPVEQKIIINRTASGKRRGFRVMRPKDATSMMSLNSGAYPGNNTSEATVQAMQAEGIAMAYGLAMPTFGLDGLWHDLHTLPDAIVSAWDKDLRERLEQTKLGVQVSNYADFVVDRREIKSEDVAVKFDFYGLENFKRDVSRFFKSDTALSLEALGDLNRLSVDSNYLPGALLAYIFLYKPNDNDFYAKFVKGEYCEVGLGASLLTRSLTLDEQRDVLYRAQEMTGGFILETAPDSTVVPTPSSGMEFIMHGVAATYLSRRDDIGNPLGHVAYEAVYSLGDIYYGDSNNMFSYNSAMRVYYPEGRNPIPDTDHLYRYNDMEGSVNLLLWDTQTNKVMSVSSIETDTVMKDMHDATFQFLREEYTSPDEVIYQRFKFILPDFNVVAGTVIEISTYQDGEGKTQINSTTIPVRGGMTYADRGMPYQDIQGKPYENRILVVNQAA